MVRRTQLRSQIESSGSLTLSSEQVEVDEPNDEEFVIWIEAGSPDRNRL